MTTSTIVKYVSVYTKVSMINDSQTTVQLEAKLSTLSETERSWDSPTTATEEMTSLSQSSLLTTKQSTVKRPNASSNQPIHTSDSTNTSILKTTSTSRPSTIKSYTMLTTSKTSVSLPRQTQTG